MILKEDLRSEVKHEIMEGVRRQNQANKKEKPPKPEVLWPNLSLLDANPSFLKTNLGVRDIFKRVNVRMVIEDLVKEMDLVVDEEKKAE